MATVLGFKKWLYAGVAIATAIALLIFGSLYRDFVHQAALQNLQNATAISARSQTRALESELQKFTLLPLVMSENPQVHSGISAITANRAELNKKLASLAQRTGAPYIYVIDTTGTTVASSNYDRDDSFVGRRYEFRPYFKRAMQDGSAQYFAKGERTGKAGLFLARRLDAGDTPLGVIVVKVEFEQIARHWQESNATTFVVDNDDIILFSSDSALNYSTLTPLSVERRQDIESTLQFGTEPLQLAQIELGNTRAPDEQLHHELSIGTNNKGEQILTEVLEIRELGWRLVSSVQIAPTLRAADLRIQLTMLTVGGLIISAGLFIAWRISRARRVAQTTEYLKTEVARQTQELLSANTKLGHEINERRQIDERFRKAREELAQANRLGSIGTITTSVAHEINQPVAAIQAFAESGSKFLDRAQYDRVDENLNSIVNLTGKIGAITAELRCYARRGEYSISRIALTKIAIDDVLDGVELLVGDRIRASGVTFNVRQDSDNKLYVKAGKVRLEQVLVNLLQNSSEAVENTASPRIEMVVSETKDHVHIKISDNGPGIESDTATNIFTPFFTTKPNGLGMGLGIAKSIIDDFGGTMELVPSELSGAAFKLELIKL